MEVDAIVGRVSRMATIRGAVCACFWPQLEPRPEGGELLSSVAAFHDRYSVIDPHCRRSAIGNYAKV